MPTIGVILRKFFGIFIFIGSIFKNIYGLCFRTRSSNIGELPFQISKQERAFNEITINDGSTTTTTAYYPSNNTTNLWNNWSDETFGVESKIEEYRKNKAAELLKLQQQQQKQKNNNNNTNDSTTIQLAKESTEPDFFNEMQPKFKHPKKLHLYTEKDEDSKLQRNLFEVRANDVFVPESATAELGDLDLGDTMNHYSNNNDIFNYNTNNNQWGDDELLLQDNAVLEEMEREQKRLERLEKHRTRQLEHERRLTEKRSKQQQQQQAIISKQL